MVNETQNCPKCAPRSLWRLLTLDGKIEGEFVHISEALEVGMEKLHGRFSLEPIEVER